MDNKIIPPFLAGMVLGSLATKELKASSPQTKKGSGCLGFIILILIIIGIRALVSNQDSTTRTLAPSSAHAHRKAPTHLKHGTIHYRIPGVLDIRWGDSPAIVKKKMSKATKAWYEGAGPDAIQFQGGTYFDDHVDKWIFSFHGRHLNSILLTYLNYSTNAFFDKVNRLESSFGSPINTDINPRDGTYWQFPDGSNVKIYTAYYDTNPTIFMSYNKSPEN